jgi:flavin reductase (DIM6/NTAB) family NADH-FMN oxidoreductase RutF
MLAVSIRPSRYSHTLIQAYGEFVVNIPRGEMEVLTDYVGVTTGQSEDKWKARGLTPIPSQVVAPPLIDECPVNLECRVVQSIMLPSHTMFIGQVVAMHAWEEVLGESGEVDLGRFSGLSYGATVVRERPIKNVKVAELREKVTQDTDVL